MPQKHPVPSASRMPLRRSASFKSLLALLLLSQLIACKPKGVDATTKSLENFASGRVVKLNKCFGPLQVQRQISANISGYFDQVRSDSLLMQPAIEALSAAPRRVLERFQSAGGRIIIARDIASLCSAGGQDTSESSVGGGSCFLDLVQANARSVRIVVSNNEKAIRHGLLRSLFYWYFARSGFDTLAPSTLEDSDLITMKLALGNAFVRDISQSPFFDFQTLTSVYGQVDRQVVFRSVRNTSDIVSSLPFTRQPGESINAKERAERLHNALAFTAAEAADSFFCSRLAPESKQTLSAVLAASYEFSGTSAWLTTFLDRSANSQSIMLRLFPLTHATMLFWDANYLSQSSRTKSAGRSGFNLADEESGYEEAPGTPEPGTPDSVPPDPEPVKEKSYENAYLDPTVSNYGACPCRDGGEQPGLALGDTRECILGFFRDANQWRRDATVAAVSTVDATATQAGRVVIGVQQKQAAMVADLVGAKETAAAINQSADSRLGKVGVQSFGDDFNKTAGSLKPLADTVAQNPVAAAAMADNAYRQYQNEVGAKFELLQKDRQQQSGQAPSFADSLANGIAATMSSVPGGNQVADGLLQAGGNTPRLQTQVNPQTGEVGVKPRTSQDRDEADQSVDSIVGNVALTVVGGQAIGMVKQGTLLSGRAAETVNAAGRVARAGEALESAAGGGRIAGAAEEFSAEARAANAARASGETAPLVRQARDVPESAIGGKTAVPRAAEVAEAVPAPKYGERLPPPSKTPEEIMAEALKGDHTILISDPHPRTKLSAEGVLVLDDAAAVNNELQNLANGINSLDKQPGARRTIGFGGDHSNAPDFKGVAKTPVGEQLAKQGTEAEFYGKFKPALDSADVKFSVTGNHDTARGLPDAAKLRETFLKEQGFDYFTTSDTGVVDVRLPNGKLLRAGHMPRQNTPASVKALEEQGGQLISGKHTPDGDLVALGPDHLGQIFGDRHNRAVAISGSNFFNENPFVTLGLPPAAPSINPASASGAGAILLNNQTGEKVLLHVVDGKLTPVHVPTYQGARTPADLGINTGKR